MSKILAGEIALVTGASRGIGAAIADALAAHGAVVIGTATTQAGADAISARLGGQGGAGRVLDVSVPGAIEALTHHAGTSRNKVVNQLLEVGLEATLAALPEDLAEDLRRRCGEVIHESLSKNGGTWERGEA